MGCKDGIIPAHKLLADKTIQGKLKSPRDPYQTQHVATALITRLLTKCVTKKYLMLDSWTFFEKIRPWACLRSLIGLYRPITRVDRSLHPIRCDCHAIG